MTARVTTLKGASAGAYYVEALPSYYLDSGEPRGIWHGRGAGMLGLGGTVSDDRFLRIMAGHDPHAADEIPLGRRYGDDSVKGFDVTASAPKSVSTLFAIGDEQARANVLAAHDLAVATMIDWIEAHAHTRFRIVAVVHAQGIIAATFRQHTSRALDPQLHTHVVIANRVMSPDGRWLALDARTLKLDQRTLSSIYHATLRSDLTDRLGVMWEPVENGIAEIANMPKVVLEEFSTRTLDVQKRIDVKIDRFIDTFDRQPTARERWKLEREAVVDSRPAKIHNTDAASLHEVWGSQVEALGIAPDRLVATATDWVTPRPLDTGIETETVAIAIAALEERQSTWRPAELTREIAAALPTDVRIDPKSTIATLDRLTAEAIAERCVDISRPIPDGVALRSDGRPITEAAVDRALTTPAILAQEERLVAWADRRMVHPGIDSAEAVHRSVHQLTAPQAQTAAATAGTRDLVLVVGPAGTGKTTALAPAIDQLRAAGRPVFGVAPSAAAADVLATETGVEADTIDKLLTEHSLKRPPDHRYNLPAGATVIVDEAAMVATDQLDRLANLADTRGWRVALVGDPLQFSAVGRGGMFQYLVETYGAIELDQVHRFTNEWEREASLRLRRGDPSVAEVYDEHGRLHAGTATRMHDEALQVWRRARWAGETVLLAAPTNDAVVELNKAAQQIRIDVGELDPRRRAAHASDYRIHVGDEIVTRRNDRQMHTDQKLMVRNRDQWTVDVVHRNGDLTVHGYTGTVRLPSHYVQDHVELAYAQTSHASQGRTVDRSILVLDGATDVRGLYVPMTRGRHHNDAYIATIGEQTAVDVFAESLARSWIDQPAIRRQAELAGHDPHRPGTLPATEVRGLLEEKATLNDVLDRLERDLARLPRDLDRAQVERAQAVQALKEMRVEIEQANETIETRDRLLRRRGHETEIASAHDAVERLPGQVQDKQADIRDLDQRIEDLTERLDRAERTNERAPRMYRKIDDINARLGDDRHVRHLQMRHNPPAHIVEALGERPYGGQAAFSWDNAAAQLDQHRAAFGIAIPDEPWERLPRALQDSANLTNDAIRQLRRIQQPEITRDLEGPSFGIGM
ncbi:MAG: MobF family relaxase [Acidimicrobiales bacterium]